MAANHSKNIIASALADTLDVRNELRHACISMSSKETEVAEKMHAKLIS